MIATRLRLYLDRSGLAYEVLPRMTPHCDKHLGEVARVGYVLSHRSLADLLQRGQIRA